MESSTQMEASAAAAERAPVQVGSAEVVLDALLPGAADAQSRRYRAVSAVAGAETQSAALRLLLDGVQALGPHYSAIFTLREAEPRLLLSRGGSPRPLPAGAAQAVRSGSTVLTPQILATPLLLGGEGSFALVLEPSPPATSEGLAFLAALLAACHEAMGRAGLRFAPQPASRLLALWREEPTRLGSATRRALSQIEEIAPKDEPLLLVGEPFTGRRDAALAVHQLGARADEAFVDLAEFGGEPEAVDRAIRLAEGGTLYLGPLPTLGQAAHERLVREIRATAARSPVRFVAATVPNDRATRELFAPYTGAVVEIPALRRRKSELRLLSSRRLASRSPRVDEAVPNLSAAALRAMRAYGWPGNFAELGACLDWARLACAPNAEIQLWDLPPEVRAGSTSHRSTRLSDMVSAVERLAIVEALGQHHNKKIHAALALGISRPTLDKKIDAYKIMLKRSAT